MIGYFTNQYPKVSHSFIRREIAAVESLGHQVRRYALRGWDGDAVDPLDLVERDLTAYVLYRPARALLSLAMQAIRRPLRTLGVLALLGRFAHRSNRGWPKHLAALAEAALLAEWLRRDGITHLHVHFGTNPAEVAALAGRWADVPFSFTVHGPDEFDSPRENKLGLKAGEAAFVVAISDFCVSQLYRWVDPAHWTKVHVVRCGLDERYSMAVTTPLPSAPRLVCVARLSEQKGHLLLITAFAQLAARHPEMELVMVGDGELRATVESALAAAGLGNRVRITGWVGEEEVRRELAAARGMILPSFAEGLPIVIMEALALGRPVLATNVAAVAELVENERTGWLFAPGSHTAIADAIAGWLQASDAELSGLAARGRERVLARHDASRSAERLATLFNQAASC